MSRSYRPRKILPTLLWRGALLLLLWWVLSEGEGDIVFGTVTAMLAVLASLMLVPPGGTPGRLQRLMGLARFIPFFISNSLLGGWDVALRALQPRLPLAPCTIDYPLVLPAGWPSVIFLATVSLMPGTLAVRLDERQATIHLLDGSGDPLPSLQRVEQRVADLFGIKVAG